MAKHSLLYYLFQFYWNFIKIELKRIDWGVYMKTSQSDYKWIIYVHVNVAIMLRDNMEGRTT